MSYVHGIFLYILVIHMYLYVCILGCVQVYIQIYIYSTYIHRYIHAHMYVLSVNTFIYWHTQAWAYIHSQVIPRARGASVMGSILLQQRKGLVKNWVSLKSMVNTKDNQF